MAFSQYDSNFPYSPITQRMFSLLPSWMKMNKMKESVGQQLMNAGAGIEMEDIEEYLDQLLNNQYVGKANLGEISWIYRASYDQDLNAHSNPTITGILAGDEATPIEVSITEVDTLREFYEASSVDNVGIFDFDNKILYVRRDYSSITINDEELLKSNGDIELHHVWNSFDEIGLVVGLMRYHGESNSDFKTRIMNVFKYPGDARKIGLTRYIAGQLGLIKSEDWLAATPTLSLPTAIEDTIKLGSEFIPPEQNDSGSISPSIPIFPRDDFLAEIELENDDGLYLSDGELTGSIRTPVIYPDNLSSWTKITAIQTVPNGTSVKYRLIDIYGSLIQEGELSSGELSINNDPNTSQPLATPIILEVAVTRPDLNYSSPVIESISIEYANKDSIVTYIDSNDISLDVLFDETFKDTLFNPDGSPTQEMKMFVQELSDVAPILWDQFKWDEAYWDVVSKSIMGLDVLPNKWDPNINAIANKYLQVGIGDNNDLKVRIAKDGSWAFEILSGYYFIGDGANPLEEFYLYANPKEENVAGPVNSFVINDTPKQGEPIHITAKTDEATPQDVTLTQVAFLDDSLEYTLTNTEIVNIEDGKLYLKYANLEIGTVTVDTNEATPQSLNVDYGSYDGSNVVNLLDGNDGDEVVVTYQIKDSFYADIDDDSMTVYMSDTYTDIVVTFETDNTVYYKANIDIDPRVNHIDRGFLYIVNETKSLGDFNIVVSPDVVKANGYDRALIIVDAVDRDGNPVFDVTINTNISGQTDEATPAALADPGTLELSDTHYNRSVYRYTAPDSIPSTSATVTLQFTSGSISKSVEIKVR